MLFNYSPASWEYIQLYLYSCLGEIPCFRHFIWVRQPVVRSQFLTRYLSTPNNTLSISHSPLPLAAGPIRKMPKSWILSYACRNVLILFLNILDIKKISIQFTRGNMQCPKKPLKEYFLMWWHLNFYLKCPKIEKFHFWSLLLFGNKILRFWGISHKKQMRSHDKIIFHLPFTTFHITSHMILPPIWYGPYRYWKKNHTVDQNFDSISIILASWDFNLITFTKYSGEIIK